MLLFLVIKVDREQKDRQDIDANWQTGVTSKFLEIYLKILYF